MKKIFILSLFICLICGCSKIQDKSIEEIVDNGTQRTVSVYNKYRKGYKYNTPKSIDTIDSTEYNEVLASSDYKYYLYVDAVSYYNKVIEKYEVNDTSYVSMPISYEDKYGYLEINKLNNGKYFIEIMYNYAKIEVIVKEEDIKVTIANALSIITSIKFNDNILSKVLDENYTQFGESDFNIFETATTTDSEYLQAVDADIYEEDEEIHDTDLVN